MKNLISVLSVMLMFASCKKDEPIPFTSASTPRTTFTGVVFIQSKYDVCNTSTYFVRKLAPVDDTLLDVENVIDGTFMIGSPVTYDSVALVINPGDSLLFETYKTTQESVLINPIPQIDYSVRMKIYMAGVVVKDTAGNMIHWEKRF